MSNSAIEDWRSSYRDKPAVDIEPLIRYLEWKGRGTWRDFDSAAKESVLGLRDSYELAARLAVQCLLEFDWRDSSWEFGPTTLVEGREGYLSPTRDADSNTPARWRMYGASDRTATHFETLLSVESEREFINLDLRRNRMTACFTRHAFPVEFPADRLNDEWLPEFVDRKDLEAMFAALPNIKLSGAAFVGESATEAADTLRAASQTQRFDTNTNTWTNADFNESVGFWRVDSMVKRYYLVSIVPKYQIGKLNQRPSGTTIHIARVSPELGRWFCAPNPGTAQVDAMAESLTISLSRAVFDLPVLHERWLTLWGSQRQALDLADSYAMKFDGLHASFANKLISLLSLRGV